MSNQDSSSISGGVGEKAVQQIAIQKATGASSFPIDLAQAKIAHVKPTAETLKVAAVQGSTQQATATYRTISTGQASQVRVVMPSATIMSQPIMPKLDGGATAHSARAQITAIPSRTLTQTSITVTRPVTQATYLPRAGATTIQTQRLVAPIRTPTPPTVAGMSGSFVRGAAVARNSTSPATTAISPTSANTWMTSSGSPMQFIRAINPQRQRIISSSTGSAGVVAVGQPTNLNNNQMQQQQSSSQANIQTTVSQGSQQTFVATLSTVLQPRQQTATLVYTNVSSSQAQQYNPTGSAPQRYAVATATIGNSQRQVRPIQFGNRTLSSSKIVLTPTLTTGGSVANLQARTNAGNVNLSSGSLPTTRIIQLQQQQPSAGGQQLIGTGRIPNNLMLQPIIMSSGGGKIGIRPPTTISAKVQPSLTITQLGKISGTQSNVTPALATTNLQGATITSSPASTVVGSIVASNVSQSPQSAPQHISQQHQANANVSSSQQPITQIVSVNQSSGQIIAQNVNVASSATVVPLAISSRNSSVLTGTITPIKAAVSTAINVPPVAKVVPQQHHQQNQNVHISNQGGVNQQSSDSLASHQQQTSVFIHTRPTSSGNSGNTTLIPNTFMQQPTSFYYESVPASSVTVSTGVLSLTTTTVSGSNQTNQTATSVNLASGLASSMTYNPTSTYTVVPTGGRPITQVQLPVSSASGQTQTINQIQSVPLRFASQHVQDQAVPIQGQQSGSPHQQQHAQIITMSQSQHSQSGQVQQTHMIIPVQTSIKLPGATIVSASPPRVPSTATSLNTINSAFLRKRDNDGSPIRAAKNLAPTLLSMGPANVAGLTAERSKERERERPSSPHSRPGSSSGSTTVSANSSPGVDQQLSEEMNPMAPMNACALNESHFSPINEMYSNHQNNVSQGCARSISNHPLHLQQQMSSGSSNGAMDVSPKKKPRRSIEQPSNIHQQLLCPNSISNQQVQNSNAQSQQIFQQGNQHLVACDGFKTANNSSTVASSNKENTKPTEIIIKKPRACNLLDGYKQNWKAANNHFQRYSDVKPREERPPTVMDLANQAHVVQKINGWKIYHLSAQMEDLCEIESQVFDKLSSMLKQLESHEQSTDIDRVNDLIKGNMQRSKIIVDGVYEARSQIMKIFDHKSHVSDIIHRCASKRNFKKREKT